MRINYASFVLSVNGCRPVDSHTNIDSYTTPDPTVTQVLAYGPTTARNRVARTRGAGDISTTRLTTTTTSKNRHAPLSTITSARIGSTTAWLSFGNAHSSHRARCSTTSPNASADSTPNVAKPI